MFFISSLLFSSFQCINILVVNGYHRVIPHGDMRTSFLFPHSVTTSEKTKTKKSGRIRQEHAMLKSLSFSAKC